MEDAAVANISHSSNAPTSNSSAALDLSNQGISASEAARALHDLRGDTTVNRVDLSGNPGIFLERVEKGAISTIDVLCTLLDENKKITSLDLSGTGLDFACASKLARVLRDNKSIKSLGLKNCPSAAPVLSALLMR